MEADGILDGPLDVPMAMQVGLHDWEEPPSPPDDAGYLKVPKSGMGGCGPGAAHDRVGGFQTGGSAGDSQQSWSLVCNCGPRQPRC